jgi:hypothetical protein
MAQGRADVALTPPPADGPAAGKPGSRLPVPATTAADAVAEAVVVPNALWTPVDGEAYGGVPLDETSTLALKRYDETGEGRRNDGRWGALDVIPTKADYVLDLIRLNSLWPLLSGLACCAIEMMSTATSRNDIDRWGMFPFRASPRQADVLIVAGTLTTKMADPLIRLW